MTGEQQSAGYLFFWMIKGHDFRQGLFFLLFDIWFGSRFVIFDKPTNIIGLYKNLYSMTYRD